MGFLEEKPWHPTESIVVSISPGGGENLILVQEKKEPEPRFCTLRIKVLLGKQHIKESQSTSCLVSDLKM